MTQLESIYAHFLASRLISTDSRNIRPGSVFFALKGDRYDGNTFADEALSNGAACAVVDNPAVAVTDRHLLVRDSLRCLQDMASMHRHRLQATIIGITGTNGKTTTKELISRVLSTTFRTISTKGNLNNQIGVPLTLLEMTGETHFAVVEMGANHPGEIAALCQIARPGFGLVTNIGKAHLEGFGNLQGVIRTKSELYDHLRATNGTAFLNLDHPVLVRQAAGLKAVTYGKKAGAECRGRIEAQVPYLHVGLNQGKEWISFPTTLYGAYNFENVLAAICIGKFFNIAVDAIAAAIKEYIPDNNRSQVRETLKGNTLILDAYNANPTSMASAIRSFHALDAASKMLILGDMLELGTNSRKEHLAIVTLIRELGFEHVALAGETFQSIAVPSCWRTFHDAAAVGEWLRSISPRGYSILLKGSRKMKLETLTELL